MGFKHEKVLERWFFDFGEVGQVIFDTSSIAGVWGGGDLFECYLISNFCWPSRHLFSLYICKQS